MKRHSPGPGQPGYLQHRKEHPTERDRVLRVVGIMSRLVGIVASDVSGLLRIERLKIWPNQLVVEHDGKQFLITVTQIRKPREHKLG